MADLIAHNEQANYNKQFAQYLNQIHKYRDWVITIAFYAALHLVEAGLIDKNKATTADLRKDDDTFHQTRLDLVKKTFGDDCYRKYKKLFNESLRCRYLDNNQSNMNSPPAAGYYTQQDIDHLIQFELEGLWSQILNQCPALR